MDKEVWTEEIGGNSCGAGLWEDGSLHEQLDCTPHFRFPILFSNTKESLSVPEDFFTTYWVPFTCAK